MPKASLRLRSRLFLRSWLGAETLGDKAPRLTEHHGINNDMGELLRSQGKLAEAEPLCQED